MRASCYADRLRFIFLVSTFAIAALIVPKDPAIGRAEALRRAMLAYLSAPPHEENANPAFWGPFSVVGEGSVK